MVKKSKFGPGFLIAAAFIGPGTVTSATLAGAKFGFSLLWVILLAIISAVVIQEMVGRFSLGTGIDIGTALIKIPKNLWVKRSFGTLAFTAIVVGCAAYEGGNIVGGSIGIDILTGVGHRIWVILISLIALGILWSGKYTLIEKFLIALVVIMGISFFITGIIVSPKLGYILGGFVPSFPKGSITLVLALLGTTIVPYNLFLHSSAILKKWNLSDMKYMRWDTVLAIGLGGLITMAIVITASSAYFFKEMTVKSPADLSIQLDPLFGSASKFLFGLGLFAAGLSSAITAPYAAAWTAKGLFNFKENGLWFRTVYTGILATGITLSLINIKPLELIVLAQVTNALIIPIVSIFVFYLLNSRESGKFKNTLIMNILFLFVFAIILLINIKKFL